MKMLNENKSGYKHTPLGWIPEEWEVKQLGDITLIKGEYGINAAAVDFDERLPVYIRITDIDDEGFFSTEKKKSVNDINSSNFYLKKNDLVFVRTGATVGKAYLYNEKDGDLVFAGFLIRFRIDTQKAIPYYIWNYTKTKQYWDWVITVSMRSGQPGINSTEYSSLHIPLPQLPEQRRIAAILSTWDEAITKTQQLIAQLQQRNKGLMQQLLTGKKRLKGFEKTKLSLSPINSFAKEVSDKNREDKDLIVLSCTKYYGLVPSLEYFGRKIYSDDLTTYKIVSKNSFAYATNHIEEGSIGYQSKYDEALISPMYTVFKTDNSVDDEFLYKILKSHHYIHEYQKRMEGSIDRRGGLRWNEFSKIKVPVPSLEEQKQIAAILSQADNEVKLYEQQLTILQQQKKGLTKKLLTGEIRVKIDN